MIRYMQTKYITLGSHGTALSTIVNYYQPDFGYGDFEQIRAVMPWVVHFEFEGTECRRIESYNLFVEDSMTIVLE